jgi:hypothetical protein
MRDVGFVLDLEIGVAEEWKTWPGRWGAWPKKGINPLLQIAIRW